MEHPATCGEGLAVNASLPAKLGDLAAALAAVLEAHMKALDRSDERSQPELDTYRELATTFRGVASQLFAAAGDMSAARSLPMGSHDERVMAGSEAREGFRTFVRTEQELRDLLERRLSADKAMLGE
jgi:hypothetical protein